MSVIDTTEYHRAILVQKSLFEISRHYNGNLPNSMVNIRLEIYFNLLEIANRLKNEYVCRVCTYNNEPYVITWVDMYNLSTVKVNKIHQETNEISHIPQDIEFKFITSVLDKYYNWS